MSSNNNCLDIYLTLNLSEDEANNGAQKSISYFAKRRCEACGEMGTNDSLSAQICRLCHGTGIKDKGMFSDKRKLCKQCHGLGRVIANPCGYCGGVGAVKKDYVLEVEIPPDSKDQQVIRFMGKGDESDWRSKTKSYGNVFVTLKVSNIAVGNTAYTNDNTINYIFNEFFGSMDAHNANINTPVKSGVPASFSKIIKIKLTKKESQQSHNTTIRYPQLQKCDSCDGTGGEVGVPPVPCPACKGNGYITTIMQTVFGRMQKNDICEACHSHGYCLLKECSVCHGKGVVERMASISITIPAGVNSLNLNDKGDYNLKTSTYGNIEVQAEIK